MGGRRATSRLGAGRVLGLVAVLTAVISAVSFAVVSPPAESTPEYSSQFNAKYKTRGTKLEGCTTCHTSPSPSKENINPYATDFAAANHDFGAIETKDSDGDGATNIDEINAKTFPGDPSDKPS